LCSILSRDPFEPELLVAVGAIPKIHVDQGLMGDFEPLAHLPEIGERILVEPDRDLLFRPLGRQR
jgi:hypothetical protein